MTVSELIEELKQYDPNMLVKIFDRDYDDIEDPILSLRDTIAYTKRGRKVFCFWSPLDEGFDKIPILLFEVSQ
jgi:hypothetical protein